VHRHIWPSEQGLYLIKSIAWNIEDSVSAAILILVWVLMIKSTSAIYVKSAKSRWSGEALTQIPFILFILANTQTHSR